jgi:hypothetical protein
MRAAFASQNGFCEGYNGATVATQTQIAMRCEALKGVGGVKKKARRIFDAPSNKTYGNCLLGFHCSQKAPAENRAVA